MNWKDLEDKLKDYVTLDLFNARLSPVEKITYGGAGLLLAGLLTYALSFLFKK